MGKEKSKGVKGVPNRHIHARVSYLQQAATYLALQVPSRVESATSKPLPGSKILPDAQDIDAEPPDGQVASTHEVDTATQHELADSKLGTLPSDYVKPPTSQPQRLSSHLMAVALKSQVRLHPELKRGICKVCYSLLIEGSTCTKSIENLSKGGRKPWADVLVIRCLSCGTAKRFPIGAKRQPRKQARNDSKGTPILKE